MPECHKCPHNGKGLPVCLTCEGPPKTLSNAWANHISIDSGDSNQTLGEVEAALQVWSEGGRRGDTSLVDNVSPDAWRVAMTMLDLDLDEFRLIKGLLREGKSMATIAREEKLTRAAISARVKRLTERHPVFSFLRRR